MRFQEALPPLPPDDETAAERRPEFPHIGRRAERPSIRTTDDREVVDVRSPPVDRVDETLIANARKGVEDEKSESDISARSNIRVCTNSW